VVYKSTFYLLTYLLTPQSVIGAITVLCLHRSNLSVESTRVAEPTQVLTQMSSPMHSMFSHYITVYIDN